MIHKQQAAHQQHDGRAEAAEQLHQRHEDRPDAGGLEVHSQQLLVFGLEVLGFIVLAGERLDHAHTGKVLLSRRVQNGGLLADVDERRANALVELPGRQRHQRREYEQRQHQLPAHDAHEDQRADKVERIVEHGDQPRRNQVAHAIDIAGHAGHDLTDAMMIVKRIGQLLKMPVQPRAQIVCHVLRNALQHQRADIG